MAFHTQVDLFLLEADPLAAFAERLCHRLLVRAQAGSDSQACNYYASAHDARLE